MDLQDRLFLKKNLQNWIGINVTLSQVLGRVQRMGTNEVCEALRALAGGGRRAGRLRQVNAGGQYTTSSSRVFLLFSRSWRGGSGFGCSAGGWETKTPGGSGGSFPRGLCQEYAIRHQVLHGEVWEESHNQRGSV